MKPLRLDRQTAVRAAIEHAIQWWKWHGSRPGFTTAAVRDHCHRVMQLPPDTAPDVLDEIEGYPETWGRCDGCSRQVAARAQVGAERDDESSTATLCRDCLLEALALLPEPVEVKP